MMKRLILIAALLLCLPLSALHAQKRHALGPVNSYFTDFPATETPLSQNGRWINIGLSGLDWSNMRTTPGLAYGTQTGLQGGGVFNDSASALTGTWGATQTLTAKVKATNQQCSGSDFEEVELWARLTVSSHVTKGYEVNFRNCVGGVGGQYIGIVKWLGPVGGTGVQYTQLGSNCDNGTGYTVGITDNDVIKITITGTTTTIITAFVNGAQQCQQQDTSSPYLTGNPGIGHWVHWNTTAPGTAQASDYGLRNLLVTAS